MPTWNLSAGDPLSLTLAADARLPGSDYVDDQVWELSLSGGEPPALALETTYGLRAQRMRIFPRFILSDEPRSDPASFYSPPRILTIYPNYLALSFFAYKELEVVAEYWIAESQVAAGRLQMVNHSILPLNFRVELVALLVPGDRQGGMAPINLGGGQALAGETGNLQPVFYLSGMPQAAAGPYPALALDLSLYPGNSHTASWAMAGLHTQLAGLEAAQRVAGRSWDAEAARIALMNQSQGLQIETGNPEWDAVLAMTQKNAFGLFLCNRLNLPEPSFVLARRPEHGYSPRGDGGDYPLMWAGQTALDSYYLASLLPGAPQLAAGLLRNFIAAQDGEGRIEWRPGLAGQRTRRLAQPILACLALHIAQVQRDEEAQQDWLNEVYPSLLRFFYNWLRPDHDTDGDGFPEWENALQTGLDESPVFNRFGPEPKGTDASRVESPSLAAMLYRECTSLLEMARLIGAPAESDVPVLKAALERLTSGLDEAWDAEAGIFRYRDYVSHLSLPSINMLSFQGSGQFSTKRRIKQPRRLVIRLEAFEERTYAATLTITGYTPQGEVTETIGPRKFAWLSGKAHVVTQHTYLAVEQVDVVGLGPRDRGRVFAPDLTQEDCSLLLPLWAGACTPERARQLVETCLLPRFRRPHGISLAPAGADGMLPQIGTLSGVSMLWNHLLGEGLLRYGYRAEAGALLENLLAVSAAALKQQRAFQQWYQAENGQPYGERAHLHGFAPLGLFLKTLGIQQFSTQHILLDGFSPFSSPITVQYRRVKITCYSDHTEVSVAGGVPVSVDQPGPHRLIL
jgi:hypothetical protein